MPQAHQLGRYQLLDRIAYGGMAEIYRAKTFDSEGRPRLVAVKRVLSHLTADDDFIRMIVDEAKITATLDHEAIARVYEFSQAGDEYFIAMEYVDGKDVRALLEKHRQSKTPIPAEHVAWVISAVAEGLHAAHTQADADGQPLAIVHRDVSPSNCLCAYAGEVKLCDFGIAKATLTRVQTRTGVIKGKVKYMSPEQAMGRKLDARSDLFSLGTVMYEMLTLEAPFSAATEVELIFAVRDAKKRDARSIVPSIPEAIEVILNRMMERQRTDRYQSGRELARDLRAVLEKLSPGYRRASFSRYMRATFKDEIDKELRQLEGWVIEDVDASKVGVNLIADAMPEDAPYRSFFPASTHISVVGAVLGSDNADLPAQATSFFKRDQAPGDLHAQPTQIFTRGTITARGDLHQQSTMMLEGRAADDLLARVRASLSASPSGLHDHETRLLDQPAPTPAPAEEPAAELDSSEIETPSSNRELPAQSTRILSAGESMPKGPAPPPPPAAARVRHDTAPDSTPRRFVDDDDSKESTAPKADKASIDDDPPTNPRLITDHDE